MDSAALNRVRVPRPWRCPTPAPAGPPTSGPRRPGRAFGMVPRPGSSGGHHRQRRGPAVDAALWARVERHCSIWRAAPPWPSLPPSCEKPGWPSPPTPGLCTWPQPWGRRAGPVGPHRPLAHRAFRRWPPGGAPGFPRQPRFKRQCPEPRRHHLMSGDGRGRVRENLV